jgi:hypothetical protein
MALIEGEKGKLINDFMKANLDIARREIKKDFDIVLIYDGQERAGKSTVAMQHAYYVDRSFNLSRVCMTPEEFIRAIKKAERYQAVVFDEAFTGLLSRSAMSKVNKALVTMMAEIGQKNLYVFIIMPNYFMLDSYIALHRSIALCHCYVVKDREKWHRGNFAFYDSDRKKQLYLFGKKNLSYSPSIVKPNFTANFTKWLPFDDAAYRKKKLDSLMHKQEADTESSLKKEVDEALLMRLLTTDLPITNEIKAKIAGVSLDTIYYRLKKLRQNPQEDSFMDD